jgi:tryptophan-rich sensory protein
MATGGIIVGCLWIALSTTIIAFRQQDQIAGLLFIRHLVWMTLVFALNWSVWARNRTPA